MREVSKFDASNSKYDAAQGGLSEAIRFFIAINYKFYCYCL